MKIQTKYWKQAPLLLLIAALLLAGCRRPAFLDEQLPDDGPEIRPTQADAMRFVEKVTVAGQSGVQSGQTSLTLTEAEVTSFLGISAQLAQVMQIAKGVDSVQDLNQLQDLDLEGLNLEGLNLEELGGEALDNEALRRWQELAGKREGLGKLRLPDLSLRLAIKEPQVYFKDNGQIIVRGYGQVRKVRQPLRVVVAPRAREGEMALDFVEGNLGPVDLPEGLFDVIGKGLAKVILAGQDWAEINEITVAEGTLTLRGRYSKEQIRSDLCLTC
jgi:hypothetical protein